MLAIFTVFVYEVYVHSVVAMWILLLQRLIPIHICLVFFHGVRKEPLKLQHSHNYIYLLAHTWRFLTKLLAQLSFLSNDLFFFCFLRLMHQVWFILSSMRFTQMCLFLLHSPMTSALLIALARNPYRSGCFDADWQEDSGSPGAFLLASKCV